MLKNRLKRNGWLLLLLLMACGGAESATPPDEFQTEILADGTEVLISEAYVDEVDLAIVEGPPLQVIALIKGNLADGCTELANIEQEQVGNELQVKLITQRPAAAICTEALVPFEETVPLVVANLPAGDYFVNVNETVVSFNLAADNIVEQPLGSEPAFVATLTEQDLAELMRQTLERAILMEELPDLPLLLSQGNDIVLSTENIDPALINPVGDVTLTPLTPERIRARATAEGDFLYLKFLEIAPTESGTVQVSLANQWAVGENSEAVYMSGGGFTLAFTKTADSWQSELIAAWIS